jgi:quercetin dioxygenase-like cupin family protein
LSLAVVAVAFLVIVALLRESPTSRAIQGTPAAGTPAPASISSEVFALASPAAVENPELGIGRVTIMPGAMIPTHYHAGTQIGVVVQGTLTYSVFTGEVALHRASPPEGTIEIVGPGDTVQVGIGDAVVEPPGSIHQGSNEGTVPVVIYVSTLFPEGAPRSVPAEVAPSP